MEVVLRGKLGAVGYQVLTITRTICSTYISFIDPVLSSRTMCIGSTNYKCGSMQESSLLWEVLSIGLVDFEYLIEG